MTKNYRRVPKEIWLEVNCAEDNHHVSIGGEPYYLSGDGYLMPTRAHQPAPDLQGLRSGGAVTTKPRQDATPGLCPHKLVSL